MSLFSNFHIKILPLLFYHIYKKQKSKNLLLEENVYKTYTKKQISEHYNFETRIWVAYEDSVYDITDFVKIHPGGENKIRMAAGGYLEPFWEMYSFHKEYSVKDLLEKYKIGKLDSKDIYKSSNMPDFSLLKKENIEKRSDRLKKHLSFPYCSEAPEQDLIEEFYTPIDLFFVRNHNQVPDILNEISDINKYTFKIYIPKENEEEDLKKDKKLERISNSEDDNENEGEEGEEEEEDSVYFDNEIDLKTLKSSYKKKSLETITACSGNRRKYFTLNGEVTKGLQWGNGAISNGVWEGYSLRSILDDYLLKYRKEHIVYDENISKYHLICEGYDHDLQKEHYSVSVPLKYAYETGILADKYNNQDIPLDHGYPLRLIIPGFVGVRNVKWVKSIKISLSESESSYQQKDYKIIRGKSADGVDLNKLSPVYKWEVNSAILKPEDNFEIEVDSLNNDLEIKGWAIGSYGNEISDILISFDDGRTWSNIVQSDLLYNRDENGKVFGWTIWRYKITKKDLLKRKEMNYRLPVLIKARDVFGNEQKESIEEIWNFRGIMNNSCHKININLI